MVFEKMKTLIPHKSCQKFRCDSEFTIVKNFANKTVYLNSTASDIFMLCDGKKSIDDICNQMLSEYDITREIIQRDIVKVIRDLQWNRVIKLSRKDDIDE